MCPPSRFGPPQATDWRHPDLDVNALAKTIGPQMAVAEIGRRARCTECGHRGGSMQVAVAQPASSTETTAAVRIFPPHIGAVFRRTVFMLGNP